MRKRAGVGTVLIALVAVVGLFALVVGGCAVQGYNRAVNLRERVNEQWSQIDVVLQRRYELIPNLVETVKGYAAHEKDIFTEIAHSRERYFSAGSRDEKVEAANGLERALSRLLVLQERYPELKAQANFLDLQAQLEGTENRIAVERRRYNEAVGELNRYARQFLGRIYTRWAGVEPGEYFETSTEAAREAPRVDFGGGKAP